MTKRFVSLFALLFVFVWSVPSWAEGDNDHPIGVNVTLAKAYTIEVTRPIDFGTLIVPPTGDNISMDVSSTSASADTAPTFPTSGIKSKQKGTPKFDSGIITIVTQIAGITVNTADSVDTVTLDGPDGAPAVKIINIHDNVTDATAGVNKTLESAGTAYLHVGGTLVIPENAADGTYSGEIVRTVVFN